MKTLPSGRRAEIEDPFANRATDRTDASVRPVEVDTFEDLDREAGYGPLSPEILARRARLRRIVAGIVGIAGIVSVLVAVRLIRGHAPPAAAPSAILAAQPVVSPFENAVQPSSAVPAEPPAAQPPVAPPEPVAVAVEEKTSAVVQPAGAETRKAAARPGGCTKDTDCKGARICAAGRCVDPN